MNDGVVALARTLDQELVALTRGVSLACPVCSEFVMHVRGAHGLAIACPECKSILAEGLGHRDAVFDVFLGEQRRAGCDLAE